MDDDVTITEDAWAKKYTDSSKMFIEVGRTIKVGDLVRGIIIQSGNDACVAMAIHLAGTQEGFDICNEELRSSIRFKGYPLLKRTWTV